jgi:hypothetical protein
MTLEYKLINGLFCATPLSVVADVLEQLKGCDRPARTERLNLPHGLVVELCSG